MSLKRDYYDEELAGKILRRASEASVQRGVSREELIKAAAEMGIPSDLLDKAEEEIVQAAENQQALQEFRAHRRTSAIQGFLTFLAVTAGALVFDLRDGQLSWWMIFFVFWAWAAVGEIWAVMNPLAMQKAFEKERKVKPYLNASLPVHETIDEVYKELTAKKDDEVDRDRLAREVSKKTGMHLEEAQVVVEAYAKLNPEREL